MRKLFRENEGNLRRNGSHHGLQSLAVKSICIKMPNPNNACIFQANSKIQNRSTTLKSLLASCTNISLRVPTDPLRCYCSFIVDSVITVFVSVFRYRLLAMKKQGKQTTVVVKRIFSYAVATTICRPRIKLGDNRK